MYLEIKDKFTRDFLYMIGVRSPRIYHVVAFIESYLERVDGHHLYLLAAGIAFNILLYLIPMLLVAIFAVNLFIGVDQVTGFLLNTMKEILPPNDTTFNMLQSTIKEVYQILSKSSAAGIIGLVTLLWLSSILLGALRTGLNTIFHISTPRIFFVYKIKDMFLIVVLMFLFLISMYVLPVVSIFSSTMSGYIPEALQPYFSKLYFSMVSFATSFVLYYFMFRFIPNKRIPRRTRVMSTMLCIVFIELARHAYAWYLGTVSTYGKFYGTYAILVSIAIWVYYMMLIVLLSAQFSQFYYEVKDMKHLEDDSV